MDHFRVLSASICQSARCMQVGANSGQFASLAQGGAWFLSMIDNHDLQESGPLLDLTLWLRELSNEIERQKTYNLCKLLLNKANRPEAPDVYHKRFVTIILNSQLPTSAYLHLFECLESSLASARLNDQSLLDQHLACLLNDERMMAQELGFDGTNAVPIMARLQRHLNDGGRDEKEIDFIKNAISYLSLSSLEDRVVDLKPWMITAFDVDIGPLIGAGSLGKVFRGRWKCRDVVIKMLKTKHDILPRPASVDREMEAWSKLRHPNVLPFLGGNTLDNEPFIVLPFLRHQTSRDYIQRNPDCDRLRLLYETSLGLLYLHSEKIIHGNLKALNILIDNDEKPQLCDYGFARIRADINSRSPIDPASSPCLGSRNWMAPELFAGGNMTFQCDIYSFGMTMYEIFTDDIPFGHASQSDLYSLVVEKQIQPKRPDANEAPQLSDSAWNLAVGCWQAHVPNRIELSTLSEKLAALLPSSAGDGLPNNALSTHALPSTIPSTMALPQVSQPIGSE